MTLDDTILVAYADGELDHASASEVEARLRTDPAARARLSGFRESGALLRSAFNDTIHEPIPSRMIATLTAGTKQTRIEANKPVRTGHHWAIPAIAATILAFIAGFGGANYFPLGLAGKEGISATAVAARSTVHREAITRALNEKPSRTAVKWQDRDLAVHGRIVLIRTYRNTAGQYCREFRDDIFAKHGEQAAYEVRCRQADGTWLPEYRLIPLNRN